MTGAGAPTEDLASLARRAREAGDPSPLVAALPVARFLGLSIVAGAPGAREGQLTARLTFAPHLVGNSLIPALHGGTLASLLEAAAFFQLLWDGESRYPPRIIGVTVDYLRTARTVDTLARADITRQGRRIATVHAEAWQDDPSRPVATARAHFLLGPPG